MQLLTVVANAGGDGLSLSLSLALALSLSLSLKLECDKLASEKSEMQRHYIMVSKCVRVCASKILCCVCKLPLRSPQEEGT